MSVYSNQNLITRFSECLITHAFLMSSQFAQINYPFALNHVFYWNYSTHHGYKCLSSSGHVYSSRNVVFHETTFPFADTRGQLFGSVSPKCVSPSKPFFHSVWSSLSESSPVFNVDSSNPYPSPNIHTSHDSAPYPNNMSSSPSPSNIPNPTTISSSYFPMNVFSSPPSHMQSPLQLYL